jgi:hypothetical protein
MRPSEKKDPITEAFESFKSLMVGVEMTWEGRTYYHQFLSDLEKDIRNAFKKKK